jgi:hypothetical protein
MIRRACTSESVSPLRLATAGGPLRLAREQRTNLVLVVQNRQTGSLAECMGDLASTEKMDRYFRIADQNHHNTPSLPAQGSMRDSPLESPDCGFVRNSGHELEKRCRGASSSLSSLSAPEWLAYGSMKDLACNRSPRVEVFLVDRGQQLIPCLHVQNKSPRVPNSATANIASSMLHQSCSQIN